MCRGRRWGVCAALVLAVAFVFVPSASAKQTVVTMGFSGKASNGYRFDLEAYKLRGKGRSVSLELSRGDASAIYVTRPKRFDRHALVARFGDLGRVELRRRGDWKEIGGHSRCFDFTYRYGRFRGAIRFDGESVYARVREERPTGYLEQTKFSCKSGPRPRAARSSGSIVGTCNETSTGETSLFALELDARAPTVFLAGRAEQTRDMFIYRSLFIDGAARSLFVSPDRSLAKLRPPEPFYGRGTVVEDELSGRLRVGLPGAGLVPLAPAAARIGSLEDFRPPRSCLPLIFLRRAGSDHATSFADAVGR